MTTTTRIVRGFWLGLRGYETIHSLQERALLARQQRRMGDILLLLEHRPVITLGRGARPEHVLLSREMLQERGIDLVTTARGGDVTFHGPGQLVGYPIVSLEPDRCNIRRFVGDLLDTMKNLALDFGISTGVIDKYPGVWVDTTSPQHWPGQNAAKQPAKLGAVGLRVSSWVTMHGFAFNATTDLEGFGLIVPCGISQFDVTSLHKIVGGSPQPKALAKRAAELFCDSFDTLYEHQCLDEASDDELAEAIGIPKN